MSGGGVPRKSGEQVPPRFSRVDPRFSELFRFGACFYLSVCAAMRGFIGLKQMFQDRAGALRFAGAPARIRAPSETVRAKGVGFRTKEPAEVFASAGSFVVGDAV